MVVELFILPAATGASRSNTFGVEYTHASSEYAAVLQAAIKDGTISPADGDTVLMYSTGGMQPRIWYTTVSVAEEKAVISRTVTIHQGLQPRTFEVQASV